MKREKLEISAQEEFAISGEPSWANLVIEEAKTYSEGNINYINYINGWKQLLKTPDSEEKRRQVSKLVEIYFLIKSINLKHTLL